MQILFLVVIAIEFLLVLQRQMITNISDFILMIFSKAKPLLII